MEYIIYLFVFLFGLVIGSAINCLVYRLKTKKSFISGRSLCPNCKHKLAWYDNIPLLSFLFLRGKCRYCHKHISWQYPLVEFITGILFLITFYFSMTAWGFSSIGELLLKGSLLEGLFIARNLLFVTILLVIFIYDLKYYLILDKITLPAIAIATIFNLLLSYISNPDFEILLSNFLMLLLAVAIGSGFFLLQFIISKGKWIGGGDIRLGALMGAMLFYPQILVALFLSYIIGSIIGIALIIFNKKKMSSKVPFGTFLSIGTFITILFGTQILSWYLSFTF